MGPRLAVALLLIAGLAMARTATGAVGSWTTVTLPGASGPVLALAVDPSAASTAYAGTVDGGVLKSIDGGATWNPVNSGLPVAGVPPQPPAVQALAIHPSAPATIYAGTGADGLFTSTNGGATWNPANAGLANPDIRAIAIHPVNPSIVYAGTGGGVFKSTNGGATWTPALNGLTELDVQALAISPSNPDIVFAGTIPVSPSIVGTRGIFRSADAGVTWAPVGAAPNAPASSTVLAIRPGTPEVLYSSSGSSVARSSDGGATFGVLAGLGLSSVMGLVPDGVFPGRLYAASLGAGVFLVDEPVNGSDAARLARPFNGGLLDFNITSIAMDASSGTLYAGAAGGQVASYRLPVADLAVAISVNPPGFVFAGTPVATTLEVRNNGGEVAPDARLLLPHLQAFGGTSPSITSSQGSCAMRFSSGGCSLGDLAPGAVVTVTVTSSGRLGTILGEFAEVLSIARDPKGANDRAAIPSPIVAPPAGLLPSTTTRRATRPVVTNAVVTCVWSRARRRSTRCTPRVRFDLSASSRVALSVLRLPTLGRVGSFVVRGRAGGNVVSIPRRIARRMEPGRFRLLIRPAVGGAVAVRATLLVRVP